MKRIFLGIAVLSVVLVAGFPSRLAAQVPYERLTTMDWSADGASLAVGHTDGKLGIFNLQSQQEQVFQAHTSTVIQLKWSPVRGEIMTGGYDNSAKIWQVKDNTYVSVILSTGVPVFAVGWSRDGSTVMTAGFEGGIFLWSAQTGELLIRSRGASPVDMQWSPDGRWLAAGESGDAVSIYKADLSLLARLETEGPLKLWILSVDWSADSTRLVSSDGLGQVFLWDVPNEKLLARFVSTEAQLGDQHAHAALKVRFSADQRHIQAVNTDGTIRLWEIATGKLVAETKVQGQIVSAAWSPYGAQLAVDVLAEPDAPLFLEAQPLADSPIQILTPFASVDQFNALADVCVTDSAARESLQVTVASVRALPADAIAPACRADLLALAEALQH